MIMHNNYTEKLLRNYNKKKVVQWLIFLVFLCIFQTTVFKKKKKKKKKMALTVTRYFNHSKNSGVWYGILLQIKNIESS